MKETIDICFVGKDYSGLKDAAEGANISIEGEVLSTEQKLIILIYFLDSIQNNLHSLVIGSSTYDSKRNRNRHKIYDQDFNEGYFAGVVGVVSKVISMPKAEIFPDKPYDESYLFNVKLQIHSRLDVDENGKTAKPFFLSTMLLQSSIKLNDDIIPNNEDELFDYLLLFWFKEQLQTACLKGFYRTYRKFENNNDRIRGSIDIARHIRLNMGQSNGKIAYSFRENTVNNYLNHLIVAAYKHLKKKYYDLVIENFDTNSELKAIIDNLMQEIGYYNDNSVKLIFNNQKAINHPFYTEYEELRKTCVKILRNEGSSIFDGDMDQETKGILFYLPDLWEEYVYNLIVPATDNINIYKQDARIIVKAQAEQKILGIKKDEDSVYEYNQLTYPDYVFAEEVNSNINSFMIMDAKFKPKWEEVLSKPSSISEVLADYDKCVRDMVSINAHATGVIFPTGKQKILDYYNFNIKHQISMENELDHFYTLPIPIPFITEDESYYKWKRKLDKNVEKANNYLKDIIENEYKFHSRVTELNEKMREIRGNL